MNRRGLLGTLAGMAAIGGSIKAVLCLPLKSPTVVELNTADYWCVTCEAEGHAILQLRDQADFDKHSDDISDNKCGICGGTYFAGDMTHFRSGWRRAPILVKGEA